MAKALFSLLRGPGIRLLPKSLVLQVQRMIVMLAPNMTQVTGF